MKIFVALADLFISIMVDVLFFLIADQLIVWTFTDINSSMRIKIEWNERVILYFNLVTCELIRFTR